jgi:glyoxylase-like metal-dependent hydrolase (beta-lactamase superfamily II)
MCFILEEENAMFTGDTLLGTGTTAVESLSTFLTSLRKMQSQNCAKAYPAHGEVISNMPMKIKEDLAQKTRREERILRALKKIRSEELNLGKGKGSVTVKQLVTAIHGELAGEVRKLAVEPFTEEVLRKLAEDGDVAFELKRGEKRWFAIDNSVF